MSRPGRCPRPFLLALIHLSAWRNCPKSLARVCGVGLRTAEKALFRPFRTPYSGQIHAQSVVRTPFRTVSPRRWVNNASRPLTRAKLYGCGRHSLAYRALRVFGRLLRRDAGEHGGAASRRDHPSRLWRLGTAGPLGRGRRHSVRHPRSGSRRPDRLLGGARRGTPLRPEVGALRQDHPREARTRRTVLRAPRGQGHLPGPLLLWLPRARGTGGRHEPHAMANLLLLQCPGGDGMGHGGCPVRVLHRSELGTGGTVDRTRHPPASPAARGDAGLLPRVSVGGLPSRATHRMARRRALLPSGGPVSVALRPATPLAGETANPRTLPGTAPDRGAFGGRGVPVALRRHCRGRRYRRPSGPL